jgi:hypothetical protein
MMRRRKMIAQKVCSDDGGAFFKSSSTRRIRSIWFLILNQINLKRNNEVISSSQHSHYAGCKIMYKYSAQLPCKSLPARVAVLV